MLTGLRYLRINEDGQKRLQREFDDRRLRWGFNVRHKEYQAWYKPDNSRPYRLCTANNICHAIVQIRHRQRYDKKRAIDLLREIDEHNEKLTADIQADAIAEIRSDLRRIASGKQFYTM